MDNLDKKSNRYYLENFDENAPKIMMYSEEEVTIIKNNAYEEGETKGFEEGYTRGKEESTTAFDVSIQSILMKIEQKMELLLKDQNTFLESIEMNTKILFLSFFKKMFPTYIKKYGIYEIETFVSNVFKILLIKESLIVKIHPNYKDTIKNHISNEELQSDIITIMEDKNLDEAECHVEWEKGGADFSLISIYEAIEKQLINDKTLILEK